VKPVRIRSPPILWTFAGTVPRQAPRLERTGPQGWSQNQLATARTCRTEHAASGRVWLCKRSGSCCSVGQLATARSPRLTVRKTATAVPPDSERQVDRRCLLRRRCDRAPARLTAGPSRDAGTCRRWCAAEMSAPTSTVAREVEDSPEGMSVAYPTRFYVLYPSAAVVGLIAVVKLREATMTGEPVWWLQRAPSRLAIPSSFPCPPRRLAVAQ
jgi:hypothetical protein